jgi:DNA-binding HxlR family transcriptional regulator
MKEKLRTRAQNRKPPQCAETPIPCAINCLLETLTKPWIMQILWVLGNDGPTRFGALRRRVEGISSRVLAERLKHLEARGFVFRSYEPTIPPAVTYGLTNRMAEMEPVLKQMAALGQKWFEEDVRAGRIPDHEIHEWPARKTQAAAPSPLDSPPDPRGRSS